MKNCVISKERVKDIALTVRDAQKFDTIERMIILAANEGASTARRWIKVEERLPRVTGKGEQYHIILAYGPKFGVRMAALTTALGDCYGNGEPVWEFWPDTIAEHWNGELVTHWQEIAEFPKP